MNRHEMLAELHTLLKPRNYVEIGIDTGMSMALSRVPSIGIDPAFRVTEELNTDVQLVRATSDDYFRDNNPTERFGGTPLDFAFIDGMHWAEYALRDFVYVEGYTSQTSVIVIDDMLPRNVPEAARERHTHEWTGDVFKVTTALRRLRPDLVVLEVDTEPTGTVMVLLPDAGSSVLVENYPNLEKRFLRARDPQQIPDRVLSRTEAVDPRRLLDCGWWETLVQEREGQLPAGSLTTALADQDWASLRRTTPGADQVARALAFSR
ncbi:class I SAM-dependent methyltransferase [Blastococcus sp. BMG 814]|uniref:Class I SAM-dependent methyltransferase n=1 Tax=Blastococcus carthaginiensis TaxID=3050034 RepID=A0ABT9IFE7_9ACTN|nr:class I SAM-dependent methyltransferase [Blastococcus carthaginiensis]MDP5184307.1 class I SAM-dependent methyltransferase [Blastococcus carthaginiensis]